MRQHLIHSLMAVLLTTCALLVLDSSTASVLDPSFIGDQAAACADEWTSANDPEISLPRRAEHPAEDGYHDTRALLTVRSAPAQPHRRPLARAPPAS